MNTELHYISATCNGGGVAATWSSSLPADINIPSQESRMGSGEVDLHFCIGSRFPGQSQAGQQRHSMATSFNESRAVN